MRRYLPAGHSLAHLQIGLEPTIEEHLAALVEVFREVRRVLRPDGTIWLNYGNMYASDGGSGRGGGKLARKGRSYQQENILPGVPTGYKPKDLILMDAMLAMALQRDGWYLRSEIIWQKPTAMPESAADRPMRDHEKLFLFSKSERYYYDKESTKQPVTGNAHSRGKGVHQKAIKFPANWAKGDGAHSPLDVQRIRANPSFSAAVTKPVTHRQLRTVWSIPAQPFRGAHFATFPPRLAERCILAGTPDRCCAECGAPVRRVLDVRYQNPGNRTTNGPRSIEERHERPGFNQRLERVAETVGWEPTCKCDAGTQPSLVLDPFSGAGTTGLVALRHGRRYVGVEINEEYIAMSRERIERDQEKQACAK